VPNRGHPPPLHGAARRPAGSWRECRHRDRSDRAPLPGHSCTRRHEAGIALVDLDETHREKNSSRRSGLADASDGVALSTSVETRWSSDRNCDQQRREIGGTDHSTTLLAAVGRLNEDSDPMKGQRCNSKPSFCSSFDLSNACLAPWSRSESRSRRTGTTAQKAPEDVHIRHQKTPFLVLSSSQSLDAVQSPFTSRPYTAHDQSKFSGFCARCGRVRFRRASWTRGQPRTT